MVRCVYTHYLFILPSFYPSLNQLAAKVSILNGYIDNLIL